MNRPKLLVLLAVLISPAITSCSSDLNILSKSDIKSHGHGIKYAKNENFTPNSPSSTLLSRAASKPKDKHSMPIYAYSERHRVVRTTAYTCTEADHLIYGNKNAAGTKLRYSNKVRSAAADWSFYPVGTVLKIKGMDHLYVVDDYGSALTGTGTVDLYKPSHELMNRWGRRNVEVSVIQWGSFKRSAELLSGRTSFAHCRQMLANIERQRPDLKNVASR